MTNQQWSYFCHTRNGYLPIIWKFFPAQERDIFLPNFFFNHFIFLIIYIIVFGNVCLFTSLWNKCSRFEEIIKIHINSVTINCFWFCLYSGVTSTISTNTVRRRVGIEKLKLASLSSNVESQWSALKFNNGFEWKNLANHELHWNFIKLWFFSIKIVISISFGWYRYWSLMMIKVVVVFNAAHIFDSPPDSPKFTGCLRTIAQLRVVQ